MGPHSDGEGHAPGTAEPRQMTESRGKDYVAILLFQHAFDPRFSLLLCNSSTRSDPRMRSQHCEGRQRERRHPGIFFECKMGTKLVLEQWQEPQMQMPPLNLERKQAHGKQRHQQAQCRTGTTSPWTCMADCHPQQALACVLCDTRDCLWTCMTNNPHTLACVLCNERVC